MATSLVRAGHDVRLFDGGCPSPAYAYASYTTVREAKCRRYVARENIGNTYETDRVIIPSLRWRGGQGDTRRRAVIRVCRLLVCAVWPVHQIGFNAEVRGKSQ